MSMASLVQENAAPQVLWGRVSRVDNKIETIFMETEDPEEDPLIQWLEFSLKRKCAFAAAGAADPATARVYTTLIRDIRAVKQQVNYNWVTTIPIIKFYFFFYIPKKRGEQGLDLIFLFRLYY
jgi:hypothetical protein